MNGVDFIFGMIVGAVLFFWVGYWLGWKHFGKTIAGGKET